MLTFIRSNLLYFRIGAYLILAGALFFAGWHVQGWRMDSEIATLKASQADGRAQQAQAALDDLAAAAKNIRAAAGQGAADLAALDVKLDAIRKDFNNAKPAPLPVDCKPDSIRVRKLTDAAGTVDQAIAR